MLSPIQISISKAMPSTEVLCTSFERKRKDSSLAIKVVLIFQLSFFSALTFARS